MNLCDSTTFLFLGLSTEKRSAVVALALAPVPGRNNSHGNELRRDVATGESGFQFAVDLVVGVLHQDSHHLFLRQ